MPGVVEDAPTAGGHQDEIDDLFDYDVSAEDLLRAANEQAERRVGAQKNAQSKPADLGLDEEIKVEKKRAPVAKLDTERLLSAKGIPKLRRITKDRLKLKGKGHEYTDVARLLNMYQLWLDDLYPRAKFADGLAIIEKLGHQKRLQTMRREWIDEGKPKHDNWDDVPTGPHDSTRQTETQSEQQASDEAGHPPSGSTARPMPSTRDNGDLFLTDDEDGSLPKPAETNGAGHPPEDEMDELDALMAEDQAGGAGPQAGATRAKDRVDDRRPDDDFADDMEAMAEMDMW